MKLKFTFYLGLFILQNNAMLKRKITHNFYSSSINHACIKIFLPNIISTSLCTTKRFLSTSNKKTIKQFKQISLRDKEQEIITAYDKNYFINLSNITKNHKQLRIEIIESINAELLNCQSLFLFMYFLTDQQIIDAIALRTKHRKNTDIIINSQCEHILLKNLNTSASKFHFPINIEYYTHDKIHSKLMIADSLCITGSSNFTHKGLYNSEENLTIIHNKNLVKNQKKHILELMKQSDHHSIKISKNRDIFSTTKYKS